MKRLLLVVALVLFPAAAFAQSVGVDRDVLLTANGTLYTVESEYAENHPDLNVRSTQFLMLTKQSGNTVTRTVVPESATEGLHRRPALAYDAESATVFVFWLKTPNAMSSELLVAPFQNGRWGAATSIDNKSMTFRYNLRIAVTRHVAQAQRDGSLSDIPMVVVHAVWWEITGEGEAARYAMLPVDRGRILLTEPYEQIHDLNEFVPAQLATYDVSENFNHDVLRHPAFLESSSPNSVDVLFADAKTNSFNRTTLRPIMADGRLRIPVGISKGGGRPARFAPPADFTASLNGRVDTVATEHGNSDRVAMYNVDEKVVTYIVFSEGKWSRLNSLPLHEKFTADAAITAIGRMVTTNE